MSTEPDVEALAEAITTDADAREQLADAIVERMYVDDDTPEGQGGQTYRRDVLKALGLVGVGAGAGAGAMHELSEPAAASHGGGTFGTAADPLDMVHTEGVSDLDSLTTDVLNSADLANAAADTVPTAQGDGTLAMAEAAVEAFDVWAITTNQSISSGSWTALDFDEHKTDQGLTTRPSAGTLRLQEEGTYLFIYRVRLGNATSGTIAQVRRLQSGGERERSPNYPNGFAGERFMQAFGADDTDGATPIDFSFEVQHDEGASLDAIAQDAQTHLKVLKIGANNP